MKKIKITEQQADMLTKLPHRKVVKVTPHQFNIIRESLGDKIDANFQKEFRGIKSEGTLNESPTVEILELVKAVIEFILNELSNNSSAGLDPIFVEMGVTRGELFTLLSDLGLLGMAFYQYSYNQKIKAIKGAIKTIYRELIGKGAENKVGAESTGIPGASGQYTGGMVMEPSKDYNDELSPSTQMGDDIESDPILVDSESDFQELIGLEVGTENEYFTVAGVEEKRVDENGDTNIVVQLNDREGKLSNAHLLYQYKASEGRAFIKFNRNFDGLTDASEALAEVYHDNLNTIGKVLTKQVLLTGESTSYGGGTSSGPFDANALGGKIGQDVGGMTQNIDANDTNMLTSREGSKPKGIGESVDNMKDTAYPDGGFVEIDDCTKLNNNKEAENGGCSQGDDGVVSLRKTKKSVVSNQKG